MKTARIHRQTQYVPTVHVQSPQTWALRVGHSFIALTAPQARRLASFLLVQAECLSPADRKPDQVLVR